MSIRDRLKNLLNKLPDKSKKLYIFLGLLCLIFSTSYSLFIVVTSKYKSNEMYIGSLLYSLDLRVIENASAVNGMTVTVPDEQTYTVMVDLGSSNPIRTKYKLQYQTTCEDCLVYLSDVSGWNNKGYLNASGTEIDSKTIKIIVINNSGSAQTITFGASGGYTYNSFDTIPLLYGYNDGILDGYVDISTSKQLTQIVKDDTECTPTSLKPCYYGGEEKRNFITDNNNVYRILGVFFIDGVEYVKLIQVSNEGTSSYSNRNTLYTSYLNSLPNNKLDYMSGVISNITVNDYIQIGGIESYLNNGTEMLTDTISGSNVNYVGANGELGTKLQTASSNIRPVIILKNDTKIKYNGTGAYNSIYVIEDAMADIDISSITVDGTPVSGTPTNGVYSLNSNCTGGSTKWNNKLYMVEFNQIQTPLECTLAFVSQDIKLNVKVNGVNSSIPTTGNYSMKSKCFVGSATFRWSNTTHQLTLSNVDGPILCDVTFTTGTSAYDVDLSINPSSASILVDTTSSAVIGGEGYGSLSCSTENANIATCTVTNNILAVTGVAVGSTTITVTESLGNNTVAYNANIVNTSIALSETSGRSYQNGPAKTSTISGTNMGTLSCSSSNDDVATCSISGNTLTVVPESVSGNAVITVTEATGNKTATYIINVGATLARYLVENYETLGMERIEHWFNEGYEYRFVGANPDNYVTYNNESWRIIGVQQTKDIVNMSAVLKVKLVKAVTIGNYQWYNSGAEGTYYSWADSTLQTYLNGTYYNGLTEEAKSMIEPTMWYVNRVATSGILGVNVYTAERSKTTWTGIVGVPYVSDYAYADGNTCATGTAVTTVCGGTSWMETNGNWKWAINPNTQSYSTSYPYQYTSWSTYAINPPVGESYGNMHKSVAYKTLATFPTVYLKADVIKNLGQGSSTSPYLIDMIN